MKKIFILLAIGLWIYPAFSQDFFKILTEKYSEKDGFSASFITRDMFNLYLKKKQAGQVSSVSEVLKNLDNILVVSLSDYGSFKGSNPEDFNKKSENVVELHKEVLNHYSSANNFTLFKTQKTMGEDLKVYLMKIGEKVSSLAVISATARSLNLVELNGDINLENLSELGQELNLKGLESLYRINSSETYGRALGEFYLKNYGSGNWVSPDINKMLDEQMLLFDKNRELSAEQRKKFEEQAKEHAKQFAEQQKKLAETYRGMAEKYQRFPIFLSNPGDTNVVYYLDGKKVDAQEIKKVDSDNIKSIEVQKSEDKNKKSTIKIVTKK